jgi:hypothetical protein
MKQLPRALTILCLLSLLSCKQGSFYGTLGDNLHVLPLAIAPSAASVALGSNLTFTASGGVPPYAFSIASGGGSINSASGAFNATMIGAITVQVSDKKNTTSKATVTVTATGPLAINPAIVSVNTNGNIQFIAAGGTPPYTFSIPASGSGSPTINAGSGLYQSGFSAGTDTVTVTDSASPAPATASSTVTVTTAASNVDYVVQSVTPPTTGVGGKPIPALYSFTVKNMGVAGGSQPVSWWVYLSDSTSINSAGTMILASNAAGSLAAGGTLTVPIAGNWPTVPVPAGATKYLFVQLSANDDLNASNNFAGPFTITLTPPNVDYTVTGVASPGPYVAGSTLNWTFTLHNNGTDAGVNPAVQWTAYVSTDSTATIDAGAKAIDSGTASALGPGASFAPPTDVEAWPATPGGPYYLKVAVSSSDDVNTANNVAVSGPYTTTFVDYTVTAINNPSGTTAGQAFTSSFQLQNIGTGAGSQPVNWTAYVSPTPTLGAGNAVVAVGTSPAVPSSTIPFTGLWPPTAGTWYLIVNVNAADDTVPTNNTVPSASFATTPAQPDYTVTSITNTGTSPWIPGATVTFDLQIKNVSLQNGTQPVSWTVYASPNNVLDASAIQIASGTTSPLGAGGSIPISFSGPWPLHYGNYYLLAAVTVAEDVNATNNLAATASTTPVGIYTETEQNGDFTALSNYNNFGITNGVVLRPGMSILINASLPNPVNNTDKDDIFQFNTGTANSISFYMSWTTGSWDAALFPMTAASTFSANSIGITGATSLSLGWVPDASNVPRWIDVQDGDLGSYGKQNIGPYTLVISAN